MSNTVIEQLKKQVSAIEQPSLAKATDVCDQVFPLKTIHPGSLLEIQPENYAQRSAATGVILATGAQLLKERSGPLIWCQCRDPERLHLHAPGLMAFGIDPGRIIKLTIQNEQDLLWAMEEALTCSYLSGVIGILGQEKLYNFTASRRLLLRAKENGVPAILLRSHRANGTTAADIRLGVRTSKSSQMPKREKFLPRIGETIWQIGLKKGRGINHHNWQVGWNRETLSFDLAASPPGRTSLPESAANSNQRYAG